jgi:hypothetical protein
VGSSTKNEHKLPQIGVGLMPMGLVLGDILINRHIDIFTFDIRYIDINISDQLFAISWICRSSVTQMVNKGYFI